MSYEFAMFTWFTSTIGHDYGHFSIVNPDGVYAEGQKRMDKPFPYLMAEYSQTGWQIVHVEKPRKKYGQGNQETLLYEVWLQRERKG